MDDRRVTDVERSLTEDAFGHLLDSQVQSTLADAYAAMNAPDYVGGLMPPPKPWSRRKRLAWRIRRRRDRARTRLALRIAPWLYESEY